MNPTYNNLWALSGLLAVLAFSYSLNTFKFFRWISTPVTALIAVIALVNIGALPRPGGVDTYTFINGPVLSVAIFLLLLQLDLATVRRAGPAMLFFYLIGAVGIIFGTISAIFLPWISASIGESFPALSGMLASSFVGGTVNFNSVAAVMNVDHGPVFVVGFAVANVMASSWLVLSIVAAPFLRRLWTVPDVEQAVRAEEPIHPLDAADLTYLALGAVLVMLFSSWLASIAPSVHPILWLTALSIAVAQTPLGKLGRAAEPIAVLALYLFIAAVGVDISLSMILQSGTFALATVVLIAISFLVSCVLLFTFAKWRRADTDLVLVASQAGIGGPATALALAEALGRRDLRAPGVAASLLGYAIGTYLGIFVARTLDFLG